MSFDGRLKFDTSLDLSGFQAGIESISGLAEKALSGMKSLAETGMNAIKSSVSMTADAMKELGNAAVDFGKEAVSVGMNFEASLSKVVATAGMTRDSLVEITDSAGLSKTVNMYDTLEEKSKQLGASTQFSASQVSDAFGYMAMAGWDCQQMLGGIDGILNLAAASGEDLATTSDIVTDALTAFGLKAEDASHFSDVLAKASSSANTNVSMMGETFKYVAPVAGALGFSAEDCSVAIGLMANSGIKAGQAGTSLRAFMSRLAKPTKQVRIAMEELGLSLTNSDGSMKSFNQIMLDMRSSFSGLNEAGKASYATILGGQEAMSGLLAVVNSSDADFDKLNNAIYNCDGAARAMAATVNDNLKGAWVTFKSALEGVQLSLYDSLEVPLKAITQKATGYMNQINTAISDSGLSGGAAAIGNAFSDILTDAISGIYINIPEFLEIGNSITEAVCSGIKKTISAVRTQGSSIITELADSFVTNFNSFYSTGFSIISSLLSGLTQNKAELTDTARDFIIGISRTIVTYLPSMAKNGSEIILHIVSGVSAVIPALLETGAETLTAVITGISEIIPQLIPLAANIINSLISAIASNLPAIMNTGLEVIMSIVNTVISNLPMLIETGMQLITNLITGLAEALPVLIEMIPSIIRTIIDLFMSNFGMIMELGVSLLVALCDSIAENLPSLIPMIINLILYIVQVVTENIDTIFNAGVSILFAVMDGIIQSIPILAEDAPRIINALCDTLNAHLIELIAVGLALIVNLAQGLWDNRQVILDNLGQIALMIFNIISAIDLMKAGKAILTALKDGIVSMKSVVKGGMDDVWKTIKDIFNDAPAKFKEIGKNIIEGLKKGFIETVDKVKGAIVDSVASIADGIKDFLGIASPSRLMADEVGKFMPQGIAVGFEAEIPETADDISRSLDGMTDELDSDINMNFNQNIPDFHNIAMQAIEQPLEIEMSMPDCNSIFSDNLTQISLNPLEMQIAMPDFDNLLSDSLTQNIGFKTEKFPQIPSEPVEIQVFMPDFDNLLPDDFNKTLKFEADVPDMDKLLGKLNTQKIYSELDFAVNSAQSSVPEYSDIYRKTSDNSQPQTVQNIENSRTGDIIIPVSLFPDSNKLETVVVSAAARANAASGGVSI